MATYMADPPTYHRILLPLKNALEILRSFDGYPLSESGLWYVVERAKDYQNIVAPISDP